MKMLFTLNNIAGAALTARFTAAIDEEGVGFDAFGGTARLEEGGRTWRTATSQFTYTIQNPEDGGPAIVEYSGAWRGFLAQELIPAELRGMTSYAKVVEGSALDRHAVGGFEYHDARLLAEAYGLMTAADHKPDNPNHDPFRMARVAVRAARKVSTFIAGEKILDTYAFSAPGTTYMGSQRDHGDPSVFVQVKVAGRAVNVEFHVESAGGQSTSQGLFQEVIEWLGRLRPTLEIAA